MTVVFFCRNLQRRVVTTASPSQISSSVAAFSTVSQTEDIGSRSTWSKLLLFVPGAITFGLGTWQIFRRQDKVKMLEYRWSRLNAEPILGNQIASYIGNSDALEFRRVQCRGVFDDKNSIYIGPRSRSISGVTENGYYLITPLVPVVGDLESVPILVNRGWVPRSWRDKALNDNEKSSESFTPLQETAKKSFWGFWSNKTKNLKDNHPFVNAVEVTGVLRNSEKPSIFVPSNDPSTSQWFYVDVPAIANTCGLPMRTPYIEDDNENVTPSNPYPVPKDANTLIHCSVMPQDHLNYTLTWYSLSAAVTFMASKRLNPRKSR